MTSWLQITLDADTTQAPIAESIFELFGALAITYTDAGQQPIMEPAPGQTKLWHINKIIALFDANTDVEQLCTAISSQLPANLAITLQHHLLADQVWERVWLKDFTAKRFGQRLWICPDGQYPNQPDAVIVNLDPGLAFGTGSHPTTALCLEWLDQAHIINKTILDYGCGSGILAIATACLGASAVTAIDHDPQALEATTSNAIKNNVINKLHIYSPELCPIREYDVVLANILAVTLINLAPQLTSFTKPGGYLILSGILKHQVSAVVAAYQHHFNIQFVQHNEEWVLLSCIRNNF